MKFEDIEMLPGTVISAEDPMYLGRVKAIVPTWFDPDNIISLTGKITPVEFLEICPWIYPISMGHYQTFSKPRNGQKIWVMHDKNNYHEYWFMPMFEECNDIRDITAEDREVEIMMNRDMGGDSHGTFHTQKQGFVTRIGEHIENFKPDGTYTLKGENNNAIELENNEVKLGKKNNATNKATRGNILSKALSDFCKNGINACSQATPYCEPFAASLSQALQQLQRAIAEDKICSETVRVD